VKQAVEEIGNHLEVSQSTVGKLKWKEISTKMHEK
jgi:hypothetical protein